MLGMQGMWDMGRTAQKGSDAGSPPCCCVLCVGSSRLAVLLEEGLLWQGCGQIPRR